MPRSLRTTPMSMVHPQPIRWAWRGRVPLGKLTLVEGDGGAGKSTLLSWLAARVSTGNLDGDLVTPATALMINVEDGAADTIRPRVERQGGALERILQLHDEETDTFLLPDCLEQLRRTIVRTDAKLVVIDPISSCLASKVSITNDASIRRALGPLRTIAEDTDAAIILVRHLNGQRRAPAYRRGLGGAALANLARSVLVVALHPEDGGDPNGRRVVSLVKGNLEGRATASIEVLCDGSGRVTLGAEVELSADELLASQPQAHTRAVRLDEAVSFLERELDGRDVGVSDIEALARARGISERTLNRARDQLGLRPRRIADRWWLSRDWTRENTPDDPPQGPEPTPRPGPAPQPPSATPQAADVVAPSVAPILAPVVDDATARFALLELDDAPKGATTPSGTLGRSPGANDLAATGGKRASEQRGPDASAVAGGR